MEKDKLYSFVELFQQAIIEIKEDLSAEFKFFPNGSCGSACILLATFLYENGFGNFRLVTGERYFWNGDFYQEYSHSWLESNESFVIDITAYQFPDIKERIIIDNKSLWYTNWNIISEIDNVNIHYGLSSNYFDSINYEKIITKIDSLKRI